MNLESENLFFKPENEGKLLSRYWKDLELKFLWKYRTEVIKHVSSPYKNSAVKRLAMFLRWMVRDDKKA